MKMTGINSFICSTIAKDKLVHMSTNNMITHMTMYVEDNTFAEN